MINATLLAIADWLIGTLDSKEVESMDFGTEAFSIAVTALQFEKEYRWNHWKFNSRYFK